MRAATGGTLDQSWLRVRREPKQRLVDPADDLRDGTAPHQVTDPRITRAYGASRQSATRAYHRCHAETPVSRVRNYGRAESERRALRSARRVAGRAPTGPQVPRLRRR